MQRISLLLGAFLAFVTPVFSQKIFMTGDSHVSAKVYPNEVKAIVEKAHPTTSFSFWGKGGAGFYTFNENASYMDSIYKASPDILIVHLGTNGCYNVPLDVEKTYHDIDVFYNNVIDRLPDCTIVFVTPFYNKNREIISSQGKDKKYGPWKINEKTRACSDIILDFARSHPNIFVIDNNADAGTVFFDNEGLIRADNIHLTEKGYRLLGRQVAEKLLDINELWN